MLGQRIYRKRLRSLRISSWTEGIMGTQRVTTIKYICDWCNSVTATVEITYEKMVFRLRRGGRKEHLLHKIQECGHELCSNCFNRIKHGICIVCHPKKYHCEKHHIAIIPGEMCRDCVWERVRAREQSRQGSRRRSDRRR